MPEAGIGGSAGSSQTIKSRLRDWVNEWSRLDDLIKRTRRELAEGGMDVDPDDLRDRLNKIDQWMDTRTELRVDIMRTLDKNPKFADEANKWGFSYEGFDPSSYDSPASDTGRSPETDEAPGGGGTGGGQSGGDGGSQGGSGGGGTGGGGKGSPGAQRQARDNRLLDGFKLVVGPKGTYVAAYTYEIDGEKVRVGIKLGKDADRLMSRYGLKASDARRLNAQQMKKVKNIGTADELAPHMRRGDKHVLRSLTRYLNNQYEGQAILEDDEVMAKIIANSMFGWSPGEFENQLRTTKWWKTTEEHQRNWQLTTSPKARENSIKRTFEEVVNELEDNYGLGWVKHVEGGMKQARKWAETIASGVWGSPDEGFSFWRNKVFDRAANIEGTPAWIQQQSEQEQIREFNNRPEDMYEKLRSESMNYLGQSNGEPLTDKDTLMRWATDLVTERRSEGDWEQFLRNQMKSLHPYFDENVAFTEQASPYKSLYESLMRTPASWDDPLLRQFASTDDNGKATGEAMSLRDYELMLRDPNKNPGAWQEGTALWDEGTQIAAQLSNALLGVTYG